MEKKERYVAQARDACLRLEYSLAFSLYEELLRKYPHDPEVLREYGHALYAQFDELEKAAGLFEQSLEDDPSSLDALLYLAELFNMGYGKGYAAALPLYQQILRLKPTNKEFTIAAYSGIGGLYYVPGSPVSYEEALAAFEQAVETDPQQADARHNLGTALLRKGNREHARKEFLLAEQLSRQQGQPTEGIQSMLDMIDKNEPITHSFLINHSTLFCWPHKE